MLMSIQTANILIDDYLDLYLFAGKIGDKLWQQDIIERLKGINKDNTPSDVARLNQFLEKYKEMNKEILSIYQQMKQQPANNQLLEKIQSLKLQRQILGRQIRLISNQSSQLN
jgi:hypothetical protein